MPEVATSHALMRALYHSLLPAQSHAIDPEHRNRFSFIIQLPGGVGDIVYDNFHSEKRSR
jgi:hypothetical protein